MKRGLAAGILYSATVAALDFWGWVVANAALAAWMWLSAKKEARDA